MASKSTINVRILGDAKGLNDALGEAEGGIKGFASKAGGALKTGAAAAGVAVAASLTKGTLDALDAQALDKMIGARLGVPPEEAERLGDIAGSAYRGAWGDSLAETTDVVTGLSSSFEGIDDGTLEALTGQAIALGDAFEIDTGAGIQTASELMSSGLAGSAEEAFDLLTVGLQEMPQGIRDELLAASNEYGDFFADLGLSGEESFGLLTEYADDGVYGIDKVGDALKELTIRGTDMSTASVDAYGAAGLSAEDMAAKFLAGGDDARGALEETAEGLLSIEDPTERANAAIALFGTPLEDMSTSEIPGFLEGLTDMQGGLGDTSGAAQAMADELGSSTSAKLESFKRQALGGLADFAAKTLVPAIEWAMPRIESAAESVRAWFAANWPQIQATIGEFVDWFRANAVPIIERAVEIAMEAFEHVKALVDENWPAIQATISETIVAVREIIKRVTKIIQGIWDRWGENIKRIVQNAWNAVREIVAGVIKAVRGIIKTVTALMRGDWKGVWNGIKQFLRGVWDAMFGIVRGVLKNLREYVKIAMKGLRELWGKVWGKIKEIAQRIIGAARDRVVSIVGNLRERAANIVRGLRDTLANIWNRIKEIAGNVWGNIKTAVTSPITTARDTVMTAFRFVRDNAAKVWRKVKENISTPISNLKDAIQNPITEAKDAVMTGFYFVRDNVAGVWNAVKDNISDAIGGITGLITGIYDAAVDAINKVKELLGMNSVDASATVAGTAGGNLGRNVSEFHTGGIVPGRPGTEVPALLLAGERVLSPQETQRHDAGGGGATINIANMNVADESGPERFAAALSQRMRAAA